jgi:Family of unknown function (DUF6104)
MDGVRRLRDQRGEETVTFNDVADHFEDFVGRDPGSAETVDRIAAFLARVEDVDHEHEGQGPTLEPAG